MGARQRARYRAGMRTALVARVVAGMLTTVLAQSAATAADVTAFADPAPPQVETLPHVDPPLAKPSPELTFHASPKPLPPGAVTQDWSQFLGPEHNNVSRETKLSTAFDAKGPPLVWEYEKGSGYSSPVAAGGRLVLLHRVDDNEVVDCLEPETGKRYWRYAYPSNFQDRYGYSDGPRAAPTIAPELDAVYTYGAEGTLHCLELSTGRVRWKRQILKEFRLRQNFFGVGCSPLLEGNLVIINVGAEPKGPCVAAFDVRSGKLIWGAGTEWGPSYATPIPATIHGKRRVLVFAGGESNPPTGGLLGIDPADGRVAFSFPWRGTRRESVNASSPLLVSGDRIFISEAYGSGGALLHVKADDSLEKVWSGLELGTHFMSAVELNGYLYGVDGHGPTDAFLVCVELSSGKEMWRTQPRWKDRPQPRSGAEPREIVMGTDRCWLMPLDEGKRFLCLGEWGHLLMLDLSPQTAKTTSRSWLFAAGETWTPPVFIRGLLYVCQNTPAAAGGSPPRLRCYDLRGQ